LTVASELTEAVKNLILVGLADAVALAEAEAVKLNTLVAVALVEALADIDAVASVAKTSPTA
jgi:hypothetical protein